MLHSDRGTQLTSGDYQRFLHGHNLICSMSAVGHCGDNAAAEGFFGLLKRERVNRRRYQTLAKVEAMSSTISNASTIRVSDNAWLLKIESIR